MEKTNNPSKSEAAKEILNLCKTDRQFAEQLYSELYIFLNYDEELIPVDVQTCDICPEEEKKPSWGQNFMYRVRQALQKRSIEVEFDLSEMVSIIKESTTPLGYQLLDM